MTDGAGIGRLLGYSMLLPLAWLLLGVTVELLSPGLRLGFSGLMVVLITSVAAMSRLFARKFRRRCSTGERWWLATGRRGGGAQCGQT